MFFFLRPKRAIISDANFELINAYKVIRDELDSLVKSLETLRQKPVSPGLYEYYRRMNPEKLTPVARALRFIFLNKTCFNGLYRVNSQGRFNVPFGKYSRMPTLFEEANLAQIQTLLVNADTLCAGYEITLDRARNGDFVYLDPPYSPQPGSNGFTSYTKESFSETDQKRLAAKFKELDRKGCLLMLSNSDTSLVRILYSKYMRVKVKAVRMINCIGSERTGYRELLIMNYTPPMETLVPWTKQRS